MFNIKNILADIESIYYSASKDNKKQIVLIIQSAKEDIEFQVNSGEFDEEVQDLVDYFKDNKEIINFEE